MTWIELAIIACIVVALLSTLVCIHCLIWLWVHRGDRKYLQAKIDHLQMLRNVTAKHDHRQGKSNEPT